jgi:hypothetical protein
MTQASPGCSTGVSIVKDGRTWIESPGGLVERDYDSRAHIAGVTRGRPISLGDDPSPSDHGNGRAAGEHAAPRRLDALTRGIRTKDLDFRAGIPVA